MTHHDCMQMLGNNVWHDSALIITKVCKIAANESNVSKYVKTCMEWTGFNFLFKDFLSSLLLKIIIYCVAYLPPILYIIDLF